MRNFEIQQQRLTAGEQDVRHQLGTTQAHFAQAAAILENQTRDSAVGLEQSQNVVVSESELDARRTQQLHNRTAAIEATAEGAAVSGGDWCTNAGSQRTTNDRSWINREWWPRSQNHEPVSNPERIRYEAENRGIPNPMATMFTNVQISDPPQFDANHFEIFRRELLWWNDLRHSIEDKSLIAVLAIRPKGDLLKSIPRPLWRRQERIWHFEHSMNYLKYSIRSCPKRRVK